MLNKKIGWIGLGRMGTPMVQKILKKGYDVSIWNRTKSKAELLISEGAKVVNFPSELSGSDYLFSMVSTGKDLKQGKSTLSRVLGKNDALKLCNRKISTFKNKYIKLLRKNEILIDILNFGLTRIT